MTGSGRRAAVFDMDGVLVNNSRFHREAWRRLSREEGFALTDPEFWRQATTWTAPEFTGLAWAALASP